MYLKDNKEIGERLELVIKELKIKSARQLAISIGMDASYLAKVLKGEIPISDKYVQELENKFSLNSDWLLYGKGKKFGTDVPRGTLTDNNQLQLVNRQVKVLGEPEQTYTQKRHEQKLNHHWEGVPMYDAPISASFVETFRDEREYRPRFYLLDDRFRDCDFGSVIRGDSMHSEIRHGDFVVCKEVTDFGFLVFGEIYFIVSTNDLETCKYLHPGKTENEFILKAYNKHVPETPLPKSYLKKLYKVRGILRAY